MTLPTQQINQFINNYFRYLTVGTIMLLAIIFWQFLLKPQYVAIQEMDILEYQNITQVLSERQLYLQQLQHMKQEYEQFDRRALRYLDTTLPTHYNQADVFAEVDQLFTGTSLAVQSINVAALADSSTITTGEDSTTAPASQEYTAVLITVNVTARQTAAAEETADHFNYTEFKKVLQKIEQHHHLMNLEQLVYSPDTDAFTLILKTYQRVSPDTL